METKQLDVTCPCCQSRLSIDVRTSRILRWNRPEELDETGKPVTKESDWNAANARVEGRLSTAADKFDEGLARERGRERDLDDLFRQASEKLEDDDERDDG